MRSRYKTNERGRRVKTADVYTVAEHQIDRTFIDREATNIIHRLQRAGYKAYVIGGAVRDLLLKQRPKDFDLVTDAEPNQIRKLFRNSRIIGKRFRLVHIFYPDKKLIEVSTFRSFKAGTFNNLFGTIEEDALRRDFSINALYYDPIQETITDFVGGFRDLRSRKLRPIIPLSQIFEEDPVRMVRAVKYSVSTGCRMGLFLTGRLRRSADSLTKISSSRLSEEMFKILQGGFAAPVIQALHKHKLLVHIMPALADSLSNYPSLAHQVLNSLMLLDRAVKQHNEKRRSIHLSYILGDCLFQLGPWNAEKKPPFSDVYRWAKDFLQPVTPPNTEVEKCLIYLSRRRQLYRESGGLPKIEPESIGPPTEEQPAGAGLVKRRRPRRRYSRKGSDSSEASSGP